MRRLSSRRFAQSQGFQSWTRATPLAWPRASEPLGQDRTQPRRDPASEHAGLTLPPTTAQNQQKKSERNRRAQSHYFTEKPAGGGLAVTEQLPDRSARPGHRGGWRNRQVLSSASGSPGTSLLLLGDTRVPPSSTGHSVVPSGPPHCSLRIWSAG